jgi:hypothetical protein
MVVGQSGCSGPDGPQGSLGGIYGPHGQPDMGGPDGNYYDPDGSFGGGMTNGTMDRSGGGNHVIQVDGEVLNMPN